MVNTDEFIKRLEIILDYYSLSASSFAEKIGVQRSSISHLLSGRNKPSLDFILKIVEIFPDIDLYWILNGFGSFPKTDKKPNQEIENKKVVAPILKSEEPLEVERKENENSQNLFSQKTLENGFIETKNPIAENLMNENKNSLVQNIKFSENEDVIEKIVFFYTNGSFKEYNPK
jgi:transcriptional regulator with XRE-family HTH domain